MRRLFAILLLGAIPAIPVLAQDHAIGARAGLLGLGLEYSYRVTDRVVVRGGLNMSGLSFEETESGIDYDFDLDFDSMAIGVDVHPLSGAFRVSAGLLRNDSALLARALPDATYTIDDMTYPAALVGTLSGRVGFDNTAPFVAVGWDFFRERKVGMSFELGVVDQGAPLVSLNASGPIASDPGFQADLEAERAEFQAELDDLDLYPFAMIGVVVRF